jgi:2',3'-cyclic-nucleotide 2'-phosphodiesterase (5'-nucleotidase family)
MDRGAPESLLSNLVADVLRQSAAAVTGHPADLGIVNMGGLRNVLTQGDITVGDVYEILPFENSLCVLTMQGTALRKLFTDIAKSGGQGLSGARLRIGKAGALLEATVGGQPIDDARSYTLATIDYLADGNDGMPSFTLAQSRECPAGATLRSLFMKYVEAQTAAGKTITSQLEGRITVVE